LKQVLSNKKIQLTLGFLILMITALTIFNPKMGGFQKLESYTVHIMLGFLLTAIFFLAVDQFKLMFISFASCFVLCLFLKSASNTDLLLPKNNSGHDVTLLHINVSSMENKQDELLDIINNLDPDILSFQEITPVWHNFFEKYMSEHYKFRHSMIRIDPFGMSIYSKKAITKVDTVTIQETPHLITNLKLTDDESVTLISTYLLPPVSSQSQEIVSQSLIELSNVVQKIPDPILHVGDFNLTYWSDIIMDFRLTAALSNSRRDINITSFKIPYDHIFYSKDMECIQFNEVKNHSDEHVGILGTYQFKQKFESPKKTFTSKTQMF